MHAQIDKPNTSTVQQRIVKQIERRSANRKHPRHQSPTTMMSPFRQEVAAHQLAGDPPYRARALLNWLIGLASWRAVRQPNQVSDRASPVDGRRWCDSFERELNDRLMGRSNRSGAWY
jgi:hypothetical protein